MKFSLKQFFLDLAEIGPAIVSGILNLKNEATHASKTQLAKDSLSLATGIGVALTSQDVDQQADAQAASQIVGSVIDAVAQVHSPATPATPQTVQTAIVLATPAQT